MGREVDAQARAVGARAIPTLEILGVVCCVCREEEPAARRGGRSR